MGTAPGMLGSGTFGMVEPANALAPAAAPAAPANALAPAAADPVSALRMQIMALRSANDPRTKALVDIKQAELAELLKTQVVSPGQTVFRGGVPVLTLPERPERPKLLTPEEEAQKIRIAAAGRAAGTTVVMPPQEKAEKGERGKLLVKQYEDISNAARLASRTLPALESNLAVLDKGFDTGFGTEAKAAGAKVLAAVGVKEAEKFATDAQTFLANATQAVLQRQLEQKGPQTEADAQRITQTGAQLGNTKDANRFVLSVARAQLQRDIEQRNFYDKWWKDKGTYDGAEDAWLAGAGGKSLFDPPALKAFGSKTATGGAAASSIRSQADAILRGGR